MIQLTDPFGDPVFVGRDHVAAVYGDLRITDDRMVQSGTTIVLSSGQTLFVVQSPAEVKEDLDNDFLDS